MGHGLTGLLVGEKAEREKSVDGDKMVPLLKGITLG
jgi:hypothetical protein